MMQRLPAEKPSKGPTTIMFPAGVTSPATDTGPASATGKAAVGATAASGPDGPGLAPVREEPADEPAVDSEERGVTADNEDISAAKTEESDGDEHLEHEAERAIASIGKRKREQAAVEIAKKPKEDGGEKDEGTAAKKENEVVVDHFPQEPPDDFYAGPWCDLEPGPCAANIGPGGAQPPESR